MMRDDFRAVAAAALLWLLVQGHPLLMIAGVSVNVSVTSFQRNSFVLQTITNKMCTAVRWPSLHMIVVEHANEVNPRIVNPP